MAIANYPSGFRGGALIKNIPFFDMIDGNVFWVDSGSGAAGNPGTFNSPLSTIAGALAKCTAANNDYVLCKAGHAETLTAALSVTVSGVSIIGLGRGMLRPTITGNGTIDAITISAANVTVGNMIFPAPETDAQTADINIAAAGVTVYDTYHIGSQTSKNKVDVITMTSAADDVLLDGVRVYNSVVECVGCFAIEGALSRGEIRNCFVFDSIGWTNGALYDGATALALYVHNNVFKNAKAATVVLEFGNNSTGICSFNHISGRHTTLASNVTAGTGMDFFENRVTEEAALNGAVIPAADTD